MSLKTIFSIFLLFILPPSYAQNYEPLELARKIFVTGHFNSFQKYTKSEYRENKGRPNLNDFGFNLKKTFYLLEQTDKKAVVAMTVTDSLNEGLDAYLHFEKDSIWKMVAFRGLALTGITEQVKNSLEKLTLKEVDSIVSFSKEHPLSPLTIFKSREEYDFELGNAKLMLAFDDSIIAYFQRNKKEFERIKDLALSFVQEGKDIKMLEKDYKRLFITGIEMNKGNFSNSVNFVIGGITDNIVGYVFIKNEKDVPEMDPDDIIMLKPIGDGWYIYKTT